MRDLPGMRPMGQWDPDFLRNLHTETLRRLQGHLYANQAFKDAVQRVIDKRDQSERNMGRPAAGDPVPEVKPCQKHKQKDHPTCKACKAERIHAISCVTVPFGWGLQLTKKDGGWHAQGIPPKPGTIKLVSTRTTAPPRPPED